MEDHGGVFYVKNMSQESEKLDFNTSLLLTAWASHLTV